MVSVGVLLYSRQITDTHTTRVLPSARRLSLARARSLAVTNYEYVTTISWSLGLKVPSWRSAADRKEMLSASLSKVGQFSPPTSTFAMLRLPGVRSRSVNAPRARPQYDVEVQPVGASRVMFALIMFCDPIRECSAMDTFPYAVPAPCANTNRREQEEFDSPRLVIVDKAANYLH